VGGGPVMFWLILMSLVGAGIITLPLIFLDQ
jgi:hypothetical protein